MDILVGREYAGNQVNQMGTAKRDSAGIVAMSQLETVVSRAEEVVCMVSEKLTSVTRNEPPSVPGCEKLATQQQNFPPLFARIRELTENLERSLSNIEDIMRRCEL